MAFTTVIWSSALKPPPGERKPPGWTFTSALP
jgi:hypothetical protein